MREITVGNFNWTDGSAVWDMSSGRTCGQTGCTYRHTKGSDLQASIIGQNNDEKFQVLVDTQWLYEGGHCRIIDNSSVIHFTSIMARYVLAYM